MRAYSTVLNQQWMCCVLGGGSGCLTRQPYPVYPYIQFNLINVHSPLQPSRIGGLVDICRISAGDRTLAELVARRGTGDGSGLRDWGSGTSPHRAGVSRRITYVGSWHPKHQQKCREAARSKTSKYVVVERKVLKGHVPVFRDDLVRVPF